MAAAERRELSLVPCDDLVGTGEAMEAGIGREVEEGGGICTHIADTLCCTAESDTSLQGTTPR